MFERFTQDARAVVVGAQGEARSLGHAWVGTEHLLLTALARQSDVSRALAGLGLDAPRFRARVAAEIGAGPAGPDDETALRDLGIDLGAVRERVEQRFGHGALDPTAPPPRRRLRWRRRRTACDGTTIGHLPFTRRAKKASMERR